MLFSDPAERLWYKAVLDKSQSNPIHHQEAHFRIQGHLLQEPPEVPCAALAVVLLSVATAFLVLALRHSASFHV